MFTCPDITDCDFFLDLQGFFFFKPMFLPFSFVQANATLNEFASLRKHSEDWIKSSNYIMNSAQILSQTLPMLRVRKCRFFLHFLLIIFARLQLPKSLKINFIVVFTLFQQLNIDVVHCLLRSPSPLSEFPQQFLCAELHWDADRHQCRQNEGDTQQLLWVSIWRSYFCKLQIRGLAHFSVCTSWL